MESNALCGMVSLDQPSFPMNITFGGIGTLAPRDDLTPREAVNLVMMLICGSTGGVSRIDFAGFVKANKLERHFQKGETDDRL